MSDQDIKILENVLSNMYKRSTSCLLAPVDKHLEHYGLMEGQQRGAKSGCFGVMDNLLIHRAEMLDCQRGKRNLTWHGLKFARLTTPSTMIGYEQ